MYVCMYVLLQSTCVRTNPFCTHFPLSPRYDFPESPPGSGIPCGFFPSQCFDGNRVIVHIHFLDLHGLLCNFGRNPPEPRPGHTQGYCAEILVVSSNANRVIVHMLALMQFRPAQNRVVVHIFQGYRRKQGYAFLLYSILRYCYPLPFYYMAFSRIIFPSLSTTWPQTSLSLSPLLYIALSDVAFSCLSTI